MRQVIETGTYLTKSRVSGSIYHIGGFVSCTVLADDMNSKYQSDEYYVEEYDPNRDWLTND